MSWLAVVTLLFCPPLIPLCNGVPILLFLTLKSPKSRSKSSVRCRRSVALMLAGSANFAANSTVSRTVREPMSWSSCSTYVLIALNVALSKGEPARSWVPVTELSFKRLERMFKSVVLPHPEGPIKARSEPIRQVNAPYDNITFLDATTDVC